MSIGSYGNVTIAVLITAIIGVGVPVFSNVIDQTTLQDTLQSKAQHVLDTMYGKGLFAVSVDVTMANESWRVNYTDRANISFEEKKDTSLEKYNVLPGYAAIKNLSPNELVQLPFNATITKIPGAIISIKLTVFASKTVPKQRVKDVDKLLTKLLDLQPERGDGIAVVFEEFPAIIQSQIQETKIPLEGKLMMALLALTSVALLVYIMLKIKQLGINRESVNAQLKMAKAAAIANTTGGMADSVGDDNPSMDAVHSEGASGFFSFIGNHQSNQLLSILKKNAFSVEELAMIVSYLSPKMAHQVMAFLPIDKQVELIKILINEQTVERDRLVKIEGNIKHKLECMVGGADKLIRLIGRFDDEAKKQFLRVVEESADVYNVVRSQIFLFDDIQTLSSAEIKKVIGRIKLEVLAMSLMKGPTNAIKHLKSNLSSSAQAMVSQFVELKKDSVSDSDIHGAQQQIIRVMHDLHASGQIDVVSKVLKGVKG
jgi:flagellar motor switch protein FliG